MQIEHAIELALKNITHFGDTDVFPFPFENIVFKDLPGETAQLLTAIHKNFEQWIKEYPPEFVKDLAAVGYSGFRMCTQIDPVWNAYLLSLVLSIAKDIENARIEKDRGIVFSYRYSPDSNSGLLFDHDFGWNSYQTRSIELANKHPFVLKTDISDFYPRIYHHRLENALLKATSNTTAVRRILKILSNHYAQGASYGLPVGGPASRLLSELLLNRTDRYLLSRNACFCRFVDDYHFFGNSREELYSNLVELSRFLGQEEGLTLHKAKTQIMNSEEFLETSPLSSQNKPEDTTQEEAQRFFKLRIYFDPYSATAEEDYENLKNEIRNFDIVGMLAREMTKTRIDEALTKKLIKAVRHIPDRQKEQAVKSLVENLQLLYPVLPVVVILINSVLDELPTATQKWIFSQARNLVAEGSHIIQVPTNLAYVIRLLSRDMSEETEVILVRLYESPVNMMIKRDIVLAMTERKAYHWISEKTKRFSTVSPWERRALVAASFILGDEGRHWRRFRKDQFNDVDKLVMKWAQENSGKPWRLL